MYFIRRGSYCFVLILFFIPFIMFALLWSLPPSRNSDPESRTSSRLLFPLPTINTVRALRVYREKTSALSCWSTRVELHLPTLVLVVGAPRKVVDSYSEVVTPYALVIPRTYRSFKLLLA